MSSSVQNRHEMATHQHSSLFSRSSSNPLDNVTDSDLQALVELLILHPSVYMNGASVKWLQAQEQETNDLSDTVKRPKGLFDRLKKNLSGYLAAGFVDQASLCSSHKALDPRIIRQIMRMVADECCIFMYGMSKLRDKMSKPPFDGVAPEMDSWLIRMEDLSAMWMGKRLFRDIFRREPQTEGPDYDRSRCEACTLAAIGGNDQGQIDLRAAIIARGTYAKNVRGEKKEEPRLLRVLDMWVSAYNRPTPMYVNESDALIPHIVNLRIECKRFDDERKAQRGKTGRGSRSKHRYIRLTPEGLPAPRQPQRTRKHRHGRKGKKHGRKEHKSSRHGHKQERRHGHEHGYSSDQDTGKLHEQLGKLQVQDQEQAGAVPDAETVYYEEYEKDEMEYDILDSSTRRRIVEWLGDAPSEDEDDDDDEQGVERSNRSPRGQNVDQRSRADSSATYINLNRDNRAHGYRHTAHGTPMENNPANIEEMTADLLKEYTYLKAGDRASADIVASKRLTRGDLPLPPTTGNDHIRPRMTGNLVEDELAMEMFYLKINDRARADELAIRRLRREDPRPATFYPVVDPFRDHVECCCSSSSDDDDFEGCACQGVDYPDQGHGMPMSHGMPHAMHSFHGHSPNNGARQPSNYISTGHGSHNHPHAAGGFIDSWVSIIPPTLGTARTISSMSQSPATLLGPAPPPYEELGSRHSRVQTIASSVYSDNPGPPRPPTVATELLPYASRAQQQQQEAVKKANDEALAKLEGKRVSQLTGYTKYRK